MEKSLRHAPVRLMRSRSSGLNRSASEPCQQLPNPWQVAVHNSFWQLFKHWGQLYYLFSAHYDDRGKVPEVRVFGYCDRLVEVLHVGAVLYFSTTKNVNSLLLFSVLVCLVLVDHLSAEGEERLKCKHSHLHILG